MKLEYFGHSCFLLTSQAGTKLILDPYDASVGYPRYAGRVDAALLSHDHFDHNDLSTLEGKFEVFRTAGEHPIGDVRITALPCFHDAVHGAKRGGNLIHRIECDGLKLAHLGDLGHALSEEQARSLEGLDLILVPVGGIYTIDARQAVSLIERCAPHSAVAMHFGTECFECGGIAKIDEFARLTHARCMPKTLLLTRETLNDLPKYLWMQYQ